MKPQKREWQTAKGLTTAWLIEYKAFDPETKGLKRRTKQFKTKREATLWWEQNAPSVRAKTHVPDSESITVLAMADRWLDAVKQGRGERGPAEASTLRQYRYHVNDFIVPRLGALRLCDLTKGEVADFKTWLLGAKSRSLSRKVLTSLKGLLNEAVAQNKVATNVASSVAIGLGNKQKITVPAIADIKAILAKLDAFATQESVLAARAWRRYRALIATAIHTGMRFGEIRGLPWPAVDLVKASVEVLQRADEGGIVAERTKSTAGRRDIPIPPSLVAMLREWKLEAGNHALVFATASGRPMSMANIYNRAWKPVQLAAGVCDPERDANGDVVRDKDGVPQYAARYRFHDLRHFHASMLIADNANPKEVQVELGHAGIQITFDLYGHLFTDEESSKRRSERSERLSERLT